MRHLFKVGVLLLTALCLLAQPLLQGAAQEAAQKPAPKATGRITGMILCNDTNLPARGAIVSAELIPAADGSRPQGTEQVRGEGTAFVASDGGFEIDRLLPGTYALFFVYPGYLSGLDETLKLMSRVVASGSGQDLLADQRRLLLKRPKAVVHSGETETVNVTLERGAVISGQVRYADGAPAQQATLVLETSEAPPPVTNEDRMVENMASNIASEFTQQSPHPDDRGRFRLSGLQPGLYRLVVLQPTQGAGRDGIELGDHLGGLVLNPYASRFYAGDTVHSGKATVFNLGSGEEVDDVEITIPVDLWHSVSGSVHSDDGRIVNALLTLVDTGDPQLSFSASTEDDGTFRFPQVPSGNYMLSCDKGSISHQERDPKSSGLVQVYTNDFASAQRSLTVRDADLSHIAFVLQEVPLAERK